MISNVVGANGRFGQLQQAEVADCVIVRRQNCLPLVESRIVAVDLGAPETFTPHPIDLKRERGRGRHALEGDRMSRSQEELIAQGYGLRTELAPRLRSQWRSLLPSLGSAASAALLCSAAVLCLWWRLCRRLWRWLLGTWRRSLRGTWEISSMLGPACRAGPGRQQAARQATTWMRSRMRP